MMFHFHFETWWIFLFTLLSIYFMISPFSFLASCRDLSCALFLALNKVGRSLSFLSLLEGLSFCLSFPCVSDTTIDVGLRIDFWDTLNKHYSLNYVSSRPVRVAFWSRVLSVNFENHVNIRMFWLVKGLTWLSQDHVWLLFLIRYVGYWYKIPMWHGGTGAFL